MNRILALSILVTSSSLALASSPTAPIEIRLEAVPGARRPALNVVVTCHALEPLEIELRRVDVAPAPRIAPLSDAALLEVLALMRQDPAADDQIGLRELQDAYQGPPVEPQGLASHRSTQLLRRELRHGATILVPDVLPAAPDAKRHPVYELEVTSTASDYHEVVRIYGSFAVTPEGGLKQLSIEDQLSAALAPAR